MCKADDVLIVAWQGTIYNNTSPNLSKTWKVSSWGWWNEVSANKDYNFESLQWKYTITVNYSYSVPSYSWDPSTEFAWVAIQIDWWEKQRFVENFNKNSSGNKTETFTTELKSGEHTLTIYAIAQSWNSYVYSVSTVTLIKIDNTELNFDKTGINWRPRQQKEISEKAKTTIFWMHIDNTRVNQDS